MMTEPTYSLHDLERDEVLRGLDGGAAFDEVVKRLGMNYQSASPEQDIHLFGRGDGTTSIMVRKESPSE